MKTITGSSILALLMALLVQRLNHTPPPPTDPQVAAISNQFQALLQDDRSSLTITKRGVLNWDMDTFVWNRLAEKFGSNPNTPYMYNILPLGGFLLPAPFWSLQANDAVVLIFKRPPAVEYFSFTTFCLFSWKRGLVFSSLGDSLNSHSAIVKNHNLMAHVVITESSSLRTLQQIQYQLTKSGIDEGAIHVATIPNSVAEEDRFAHYEVVLRIFRFHNQTEGDAYLQSKQPVFYIQGGDSSDEEEDDIQHQSPPKPYYKDRSDPDSVDEPALYQEDFSNYNAKLLFQFHGTFQATIPPTIQFHPLYIIGLDCLENIGHQCLGDCPDAAYFGSNIQPFNETIESLILPNDNEFHLVTLVDHRQTNASIYSSIALLKTHKPLLNKHHLEVRGTSVGVVSNHEFQAGKQQGRTNSSPFFSWIFTRNPEHCAKTRQLVDGCTVIDETEVSRNSYFAYCERLYLNPTTGIGPDWKTIVPAQIHHFQNVEAINDPKDYRKKNAELFAQLRLPSSDVPLAVFEGEEPLRFLHIVKTGGESFEGYIGSSPTLVPKIDYGSCRSAAFANMTTAGESVSTKSCWGLAATISTLLCGLNCECCASDMYQPGRFHGTLLRSPRSHTLSLFSHGHNAHHTTWKRMASDVSLYLAEAGLRITENVCGHSGTDGVPDFKVAMEDKLRESLSAWPLNKDKAALEEGVQVLSLRNTQSHSLTCGKKVRSSLGQHFRVLPSTDALEPSLDEALEALHRMEWIGITDLYHPSLCLLHYQANQTLPERECDCRHAQHHTNNNSTMPLGHWIEYRSKKRTVEDLSPRVIEMIDAHTTVDTQVFVAALRLVLGRLRHVEELTGASILECIDWIKLKKKTEYIPGLWQGASESFLVTEEEDALK